MSEIGMVFVPLSVRIGIGPLIWLRNKNTQLPQILNNNDAAVIRAEKEAKLEVFSGLSPVFFAAAFGVTLFAGFVKGAVGFAMPMIMISALGSFLPLEMALAALIGPTLASNIWQAMRQGLGSAIQSVRCFRRFLLIGLVFLVISAQLVRVLPANVLFLLIGAPVALFATAQLFGWRLEFPPERRSVAEAILAAIAGFCGGLSGVWGPPTVAYLTAIDTPKAEHVRVQGVIYGLGAVALLAAHIQSGVVRSETMPLTLAMLVPAGLGMWIGLRLHDRMDQDRFRQVTLIVLVLAGLNLIRRGMM